MIVPQKVQLDWIVFLPSNKWNHDLKWEFCVNSPMFVWRLFWKDRKHQRCKSIRNLLEENNIFSDDPMRSQRIVELQHKLLNQRQIWPQRCWHQTNKESLLQMGFSTVQFNNYFLSDFKIGVSNMDTQGCHFKIFTFLSSTHVKRFTSLHKHSADSDCIALTKGNTFVTRNIVVFYYCKVL